MEQILAALAEARRTKGGPTVILARTLKGKGVSFLEGAPNWHGKALKKGDELERAIAELEAQLVPEPRRAHASRFRRPRARRAGAGGDAGAAAVLQARRAGRDARSVRHRARAARRPPIRASSRSTPT